MDEHTRSVVTCITNIIFTLWIVFMIFFTMGFSTHIIIILFYDLPEMVSISYRCFRLTSAIENIFILIINFMTFGKIVFPYTC
jgi:hypothetical protein